MKAPTPETLAAVARLYDLAKELNDVCRQLKQEDVYVRIVRGASASDPTSDVCRIEVSLGVFDA